MTLGVTTVCLTCLQSTTIFTVMLCVVMYNVVNMIVAAPNKIECLKHLVHLVNVMKVLELASN